MKKKFKKFVFPGIGLIVSIWCSISFALGAVVAFFVTEVFMKKISKNKQIRLVLKDWEIHLHHWAIAGLIILAGCFIDTISVFPVLVLGFLNGLIFHDIYTHDKWKVDDKRWYNLVYKKTRA